MKKTSVKLNCINCNKEFETYFCLKDKRKFCSRACQKDEFSPAYKTGRTIDGYGYIMIYKPSHPNANARGYILEHRYVMSNYLNRLLTSEEHVHHKNEIKNDNRIENLEIMARGQHIGHHRKGKKPKNSFPKGHKNELRWGNL